jgi:hypothetical protein
MTRSTGDAGRYGCDPADWHDRLGSAPLLIVSPHLDDAVLSCSALLERTPPIDVLTVFAGEPDPPKVGFWDQVCGFRDSAQSMPARRREDRQAFSKTPHRPALLDLVEAQYVDHDRSPAEAATVGQAVLDWSARAGSGLVALPVGVGLHPLRSRVRKLRGVEGPSIHPDHVFVRDAVLDILVEGPSRIVPVLYEELPYLRVARGDRPARTVSTARGLEAVVVELPVNREEKAQRIANYASQVRHLTHGPPWLDEAGGLPPIERYWILRPRP